MTDSPGAKASGEWDADSELSIDSADLRQLSPVRPPSGPRRLPDGGGVEVGAEPAPELSPLRRPDGRPYDSIFDLLIAVGNADGEEEDEEVMAIMANNKAATRHSQLPVQQRLHRIIAALRASPPQPEACCSSSMAQLGFASDSRRTTDALLTRAEILRLAVALGRCVSRAGVDDSDIDLNAEGDTLWLQVPMAGGCPPCGAVFADRGGAVAAQVDRPRAGGRPPGGRGTRRPTQHAPRSLRRD